MRLVPFGFGVLLLGLAVAAGAEPVRQPAQAPSAKSAVSAPLDLNTATAFQLEALPGIGEKSFLKLKPLIAVTTPRTKSGSGREVGA